MIKQSVKIFCFVCTLVSVGLSQDGKPLQIVLPETLNWNLVPEGTNVKFRLKTAGGKDDKVIFKIAQGQLEDMKLDSTGVFEWTPDYEIADRINALRTITVIFEAHNAHDESVTQTVDFKVQHVNQPPYVDDLRPFYVQYKSLNTYRIDLASAVHDDDDDPVVVVPITDQLPEGAKLNAQGELTWQPSQIQFNQLRNHPIYIEFYVEDQPSKARAKGRLKIEATQMDLPPIITVVPNNDYFKVKENATINLKFYLADPNGDDDIATFDFVSDNRRVPTTALVKNTPNQYEFIWTPGYDFVRDPLDSLAIEITFFIIDKSQNRQERRVRLAVMNAVNEVENDKYFYGQYRAALTNAFNLLSQLQDKEEELKKNYKRAKKGKRNRSVVSASLGATTGLSGVLVPSGGSNRTLISTIGGTAVATIGTLEATEVIGKSTRDLLDRYNYVLEKKGEIQNKGDVFAREYALKSTRRTADFIKKLDDFRVAMALKGLVALELDASWENKKEATDKTIQRVFKDFSPLQEEVIK